MDRKGGGILLETKVSEQDSGRVKLLFVYSACLIVFRRTICGGEGPSDGGKGVQLKSDYVYCNHDACQTLWYRK